MGGKEQSDKPKEELEDWMQIGRLLTFPVLLLAFAELYTSAPTCSHKTRANNMVGPAWGGLDASL
jgi:hypothetical protein